MKTQSATRAILGTVSIFFPVRARGSGRARIATNAQGPEVRVWGFVLNCWTVADGGGGGD